MTRSLRALIIFVLAVTVPVLAQDRLLEIRDIQTRVTERNQVYVRIAWRLELVNKAGRPIVVAADIEFQDADGFVVTTDYEGNLVLGTDEVKTFTGYHLVRNESAAKLSKVNVKARIRP